MSIRNILSVFIIATVLVSSMPTQTHAQRDRTGGRGTGSSLCTLEEPRVSVKLKTAKTEYFKNYSARTINEIHNTGNGGTILGLAGGPIAIDMKGQFKIRTLKNKSCIELSKIEVTLWAKPKVIIASNFKKGSCEYREVLAHEQKHIRTTRKFIREYAPKLRKEVNRIIDTSRTHIVVSPQKVSDGQNKIQEPITKRLFAYQNKIMPILQSRQEAIDTPEEYARVAGKCDNWGEKLARDN